MPKLSKKTLFKIINFLEEDSKSEIGYKFSLNRHFFRTNTDTYLMLRELPYKDGVITVANICFSERGNKKYSVLEDILFKDSYVNVIEVESILSKGFMDYLSNLGYKKDNNNKMNMLKVKNIPERSQERF